MQLHFADVPHAFKKTALAGSGTYACTFPAAVDLVHLTPSVDVEVSLISGGAELSASGAPAAPNGSTATRGHYVKLVANVATPVPLAAGTVVAIRNVDSVATDLLIVGGRAAA